MFENLRERLLTVQQDLASGLKSLGDKSKDVKIKKQNRPAEQVTKFPAGVELLSRFEDSWAALHKGARECARAGEQVDSEVVMLSAHWEKKRGGLMELQEQLQHVPVILADLQSVTAKLEKLEESFEAVERRLSELEDVCEQCEFQRFQHIQYMQLESYKKKKRKELESVKGTYKKDPYRIGAGCDKNVKNPEEGSEALGKLLVSFHRRGWQLVITAFFSFNI